MRHKLLLSFWVIFAVFTLTANSNAQETLQPYPPAILHTFLDSRNVYPESVTVDQSSGTFYVGSVKEGALHKSRLAREVGVSIKPGAQAPGSDHNDKPGAREAGDSLKFNGLSPAIAGSDSCLLKRYPGACAPGFMLTPAIAG